MDADRPIFDTPDQAAVLILSAGAIEISSAMRFIAGFLLLVLAHLSLTACSTNNQKNQSQPVVIQANTVPEASMASAGALLEPPSECALPDRSQYEAYTPFRVAYEGYQECIRNTQGERAVPNKSAAAIELEYSNADIDELREKTKKTASLDFSRSAAIANYEREKEIWLQRNKPTSSKKFSAPPRRRLTPDERTAALLRAERRYNASVGKNTPQSNNKSNSSYHIEVEALLLDEVDRKEQGHELEMISDATTPMTPQSISDFFLPGVDPQAVLEQVSRLAELDVDQKLDFFAAFIDFRKGRERLAESEAVSLLNRMVASYISFEKLKR